jgi:hypothetical protein
MNLKSNPPSIPINEAVSWEDWLNSYDLLFHRAAGYWRLAA